MVFLHELTDMTADRVPGLAHCYRMVEAGHRQSSRTFDRPLLAPDVDADLLHRTHRFRVQATGLCSSAHDLDFIADQLAKKCLCHLRPAGILRARNKTFGLIAIVSFSYLQS